MRSLTTLAISLCLFLALVGGARAQSQFSLPTCWDGPFCLGGQGGGGGSGGISSITGTAPVHVSSGPNPVVSLVSPLNGYDVNEVVSVLAHGAKCDGHTDDTSAFTAAITAAGTAGQVVLPPGVCVISGTLTISNTLDIHGAGSSGGAGNPGATTLETSSASLPIFSLTAPAAIHDMTLDRTVAATSGGDGIDVTNGILGANFWNLTVQDQWNGISVGSVAIAWLNDSVLSSNYGTGFYAVSSNAGGGGLQWILQNVTSELNNGDGFYYGNTSSTVMTIGEMTNITTFANTGPGVVFQGNGTGKGISDIQGSNWFLGSDGSYGLYLDTDNAIGNRISNLTVEFVGENSTGRGGATPPANSGYGIADSTSSPTVPIVFTGLVVQDAAYDGVINSGSNVVIDGCNLQDNGAHGVGATTQSGIVVNGSVTTIEGCKIFDSGTGNQKYGLTMSGGTVYGTGGDWSGNDLATTAGTLVGSFCNVNGVTTGVCYPGAAVAQSSVNNVLNPQAATVLVAGTSTYLTGGALGNGSHDDTVAIDNAIMAAEGITTPGGSISNTQKQRVRLPALGSNSSNCYFHTQPFRLLGPNIDFGGDSLYSSLLCQNYIGKAIDQESWGGNNLTYVSGLVGGGTAMSNASSGNNIAMSDFMNSGLYHLNQASAFDISEEINAPAYNGDPVWAWRIGQPLGQGGGANNDEAQPAVFSVDSAGHSTCIIYTSGSGRVAGTSTDTGFTASANHFWRYDYDGSDLRCYRDGTLVVGPLAATGHLYTSVASGSGSQDVSEIPDNTNNGGDAWPHDYGTSGLAATYDIFDAENQACATAGNCTTTPGAKIVAGSHTILAINFESTCSGEGTDTGCSLDGFQLAHTGLYSDGSGTERVYLKVYGQGGGAVNNDRIHDLSMCQSPINGADGLFSINGSNSEYDHLKCNGFNDVAFDMVLDFESNFHDNDAVFGFTPGYGACVLFGPHYGESWNSFFYCDSAAVEDVHYSDERTTDKFFIFASRGGGVVQSIYYSTGINNEHEFNDLEATDPGWITNEYLDSAEGKFTFAELNTRNGAPFAIEVGNAQGGITWDTPSWTTFGTTTPPAEYFSHETLLSSIQTPTGPDVLINDIDPVCASGGAVVSCFNNNGTPASGAVQVPLSNPAGWVKDIGDPMAGNVCPEYAISSASAGTYLNAPTCNAGSSGNSIYLLDCAACTLGTSCGAGGSSGHPCMASCNGTNYIESGLTQCVGG